MDYPDHCACPYGSIACRLQGRASEAAGQCWQSMQEKCDEIEYQAHHGSCGRRDVERGRGGLQAW